MEQGRNAAAFTSDVSALLRARNPLLWVVTREEERAERLLGAAASAAGYVPVAWDCVTGKSAVLDGQALNTSMLDPAEALADVRRPGRREAWILRDLHAFLRDPTVVRGMRSLCRTLPAAPRDQARAMIVLTPATEVPPELAGHAIVLDLPLPERAEIAELLDAAIANLPDEQMRAEAAPNGQREAAIDAALGLSAEEAQSTFARSLIVNKRRIDPKLVATEKRRVVARERVLEWYDPLPAGLDGVGGLEALKAWLGQRRAAFTQKARAYGLRAPKGVLLVGVPGCGKSMCAKAIATAWGMPLLRLDVGALRAKWVGDSEGNIRRALRLAETVAPCVLWLDEIEKALAGATQGAADGGVSADALGVILQWMQDRAGSVFVVATSNDVTALPPELLRKGRFDELFFVDLPNAAERVSILQSALREYKREPGATDCAAVSKAAEGFTGAELSELVADGLFEAFGDGERELRTEDLIAAAGRTTPLSKTMATKITALREWSVGRARSASAVTKAARKGNAARELDV